MLQLLSPTSLQQPFGSDSQQNYTTILYEIGQHFTASASVQAEAVARSSSLLDKYPFPTFVNALFGRLAELYVAEQTNDFVRLQVMKTFEQSYKHMNKLSGVNLLFDKIFQVAYNTDEVARAITLRLLGHMSTIIPPAKADIVRHKIIDCLDSKSQEELDAALFAASRFSKASSQFSHDVFDKLSSKFASIHTNSLIKEKVARCLVGLEYDNCLFEKLLVIVNSSLEVDVDNISSLMLLKAITGIALVNFIYVPEVSAVLCKALNSLKVVHDHIAVLKCLMCLTKFAHLWKENVLDDICLFASKTPAASVQAGCFNIFLNIFETGSNCLVFPLRMRQLALDSLRKKSFLSVYGSLVLIFSTLSVSEVISSPTYQLDLMLNFRYCILQMIKYRCLKTHKFLVKKLLKSIEMSCKIKNFEHSEFSRLLFPLIFETCSEYGQVDFGTAILSTLVAFASANKMVYSNSSFMLSLSDQLTTMPSPYVILTVKFLLLCSPAQSEVEKYLAPKICSAYDETGSMLVSSWKLYILASFGFRCGKVLFAVTVLEHLLENYSDGLSVSSIQFINFLLDVGRCYLNLLSVEFSLDNVTATDNLLSRVRSSCVDIGFTCRSLMSQQNSHLSCSRDLVAKFRSTWIGVTYDMLNITDSFICKLCSLNLIMTKSFDSDKYLRVMFKETSADIANIADRISRLRAVSIDGDYITLEELDQIYHALHALHSVIFLLSKEGTMSPIQTSDKIRSAVDYSIVHLSKLPFPNSLKTIVECLRNIAGYGTTAFLDSCGKSVVDACKLFARLPPMFFYASQHTVIKLSLSPQPQVSGEPLLMLVDTSFVLKVEGFLEQTALFSKVPLRHQVKNVYVVAKFSFKSPDSGIFGEAPKEAMPPLEAIEPVVNDFFSTEFSFHPTTTGMFVIHVRVEAIDESGMRWLVGGTSTEQAVTPHLTLKCVAHLIRTPNPSNVGGTTRLPHRG